MENINKQQQKTEYIKNSVLIMMKQRPEETSRINDSGESGWAWAVKWKISYSNLIAE